MLLLLAWHLHSAWRAFELGYAKGFLHDGLLAGLRLGYFGLLQVRSWDALPVPNIANQTRWDELRDSSRGRRFGLALALVVCGLLLLGAGLCGLLASGGDLRWPWALLTLGPLLAWAGTQLLIHAALPQHLLRVVPGDYPEEDAEFIAAMQARQARALAANRVQRADLGLLAFGGLSAVAGIASLVGLVLSLEDEAYLPVIMKFVLPLALSIACGVLSRQCYHARERAKAQDAVLEKQAYATPLHEERVRVAQRMQALLAVHESYEQHCGCALILGAMLLIAAGVAVFTRDTAWIILAGVLLIIVLARIQDTRRAQRKCELQAAELEQLADRAEELEYLVEEHAVAEARRAAAAGPPEEIRLVDRGTLIHRNLSAEQASLLRLESLPPEQRALEEAQLEAVESERRRQRDVARDLGGYSSLLLIGGFLWMYFGMVLLHNFGSTGLVLWSLWNPAVAAGLLLKLAQFIPRLRHRLLGLTTLVLLLQCHAALLLYIARLPDSARLVLWLALIPGLFTALALADCLRRKQHSGN